MFKKERNHLSARKRVRLQQEAYNKEVKRKKNKGKKVTKKKIPKVAKPKPDPQKKRYVNGSGRSAAKGQTEDVSELLNKTALLVDSHSPLRKLLDANKCLTVEQGRPIGQCITLPPPPSIHFVEDAETGVRSATLESAGGKTETRVLVNINGKVKGSEAKMYTWYIRTGLSKNKEEYVWKVQGKNCRWVVVIYGYSKTWKEAVWKQQEGHLLNELKRDLDILQILALGNVTSNVEWSWAQDKLTEWASAPLPGSGASTILTVWRAKQEQRRIRKNKRKLKDINTTTGSDGNQLSAKKGGKKQKTKEDPKTAANSIISSQLLLAPSLLSLPKKVKAPSLLSLPKKVKRKKKRKVKKAVTPKIEENQGNQENQGNRGRDQTPRRKRRKR